MEINLPEDINETINAVYEKIKRRNPEFNKDMFFKQIILDWLNPYKRDNDTKPLSRKKVMLNNNLILILKYLNKSVSQLAREIGVHRSYLSGVINGKNEPSVTLALLISQDLNIPVKELFYLEEETS